MCTSPNNNINNTKQGLKRKRQPSPNTRNVKRKLNNNKRRIIKSDTDSSDNQIDYEMSNIENNNNNNNEDEEYKRFLNNPLHYISFLHKFKNN